MTVTTEPAMAARPKENPEALVLRGRPRPVVRFRRGLIVTLSAAAAAILVGVSWAALDPPGLSAARDERSAAEPDLGREDDALANLPKNYGDVPRLGPPLPGDLGRPILEHQRGLEIASPPPEPMAAPVQGGASSLSAIESERERRAADLAAARASPVLVSLSGEAGRAPDRAEPQSAERRIPAAAEADGPELREPASPWTLSAGTIIPASLITGLNSDLPGLVLAQVTEQVRDSATGRTVLIPQGARLVGRYDTDIAYGQQRALVAWTRILFPDGSSVTIGNVPAADAAGHAGLRDRVDAHGWQLLKGVVLSTLLGVGTELSLGSSESELVRAVRESTQQNAAEAGDKLVGRALDVEPTLTVRPGWPVRAILHQDLVLKPWDAR